MVAGIFISVIVIAILIRLLAGNFDTERIAEEISRNGGELLSKKWSPTGIGWIGEKGDRIYEVTYRDQDGHIHEAFVKTSMLSGVYFTLDAIIEYAPDYVSHTDSLAEEKNSLLAENEQLKQELEELKKQRDAEADK